MDQVITFDKSLQQRFQEYTDVLSNSKRVSDIKSEWSYYLEFAIDRCGWQGVWKIPRISCEELKISFPTVVLVYVEDIKFADLYAVVKIIAVLDDISLPERHLVPLLQLWPTRDQDKTVVLYLQNTANSLDMYRFFYTNIFLPWDHDEEDNQNWIDKHLHSRLRLFYDLQNGTIPRATGDTIKTLLIDARKLQTRREEIEQDIGDSDIDEEDTNDERVQSLMDINVQLVEIKNQIDLLENPLTRMVIIKRQKTNQPIKTEADQSYIWLIFEEGKLDEYFSFLNEVKKSHPNDICKFDRTLDNVLEFMNINDTIILNKSNHLISISNGLENGGCLKGIYDKESTTLSSINEEVMLDFRGSNVVLENITINASYSQCAIVVRGGKTILRNCKLIGDNNSSTHQGIIVLSGGQLELSNCEISGFCIAILGNSGSQIRISDSEIYDVNYALKIYDNSHLEARNCTFHDSKEYALCLETDKSVNDKGKSDNFDILEIIPNIQMKDINGKNNVKGNVIINHKTKLTAIDDLFSKESCSRTKESHSGCSEEEMEVNEAEVTVIENPCAEAGDLVN